MKVVLNFISFQRACGLSRRCWELGMSLMSTLIKKILHILHIKGQKQQQIKALHFSNASFSKSGSYSMFSIYMLYIFYQYTSHLLPKQCQLNHLPQILLIMFWQNVDFIVVPICKFVCVFLISATCRWFLGLLQVFCDVISLFLIAL